MNKPVFIPNYQERYNDLSLSQINKLGKDIQYGLEANWHRDDFRKEYLAQHNKVKESIKPLIKKLAQIEYHTIRVLHHAFPRKGIPLALPEHRIRLMFSNGKTKSIYHCKQLLQ